MGVRGPELLVGWGGPTLGTMGSRVVPATAQADVSVLAGWAVARSEVVIFAHGDIGCSVVRWLMILSTAMKGVMRTVVRVVVGSPTVGTYKASVFSVVGRWCSVTGTPTTSRDDVGPNAAVGWRLPRCGT